MKAAIIHAFGGPDVIRIDDIPMTEVGPGEVRVSIYASSVNPVDYKIRSGVILPASALPILLGRDMSGVVDRVGSAVSGFVIGDAVYANLPMGRGGNAQSVVVRPEVLAKKPERLDHLQTGALGLAAITAWQGLFDHGDLAEGQRVLIHGAAGGIGHLAVQFAHAIGATVFATCGTTDRDFVRELGADVVIDYQSERFEDRARDIDLVLDLIGGETQTRSWSVLRAGGRLMSTLALVPLAAQPKDGHPGSGRYDAEPRGDTLREVSRLVDAGSVIPRVDRVVPLDDLAEAHRALEHDHVCGKIVVQVR